MKQFFFFSFLIFTSFCSTAQVAVSSNGAAPDANTMLDVKSSSRGVKFPRMNVAERLAIPVTAADAGLMVFDVELNSLFMYDGATWVPFAYAKSQNPMVTVEAQGGLSTEGQIGTSSDISGNYAVVGASSDSVNGTAFRGAAYVFELVNNKWIFRSRLVPLDGTFAAYFGTSVAIDGDYIVVGAPYAKVGNVGQGAAYVFSRSGVNWTETAKIYANNAAGTAPCFGQSVDISGASIIVGAPGQKVGQNTQQGSVYVFNRSGVAWSLVKELQRVNGATLDYYGNSVALKDDIAVVGAPFVEVGANNNSGAAYAYLRTGNNFTLMSDLTIPSITPNYNLGNSVSVDGNWIVAGAPGGVTYETKTGWAALFKRQGNVWNFVTALAPPHTAIMKFGSSVTVKNEVVLVGAPDEELNGMMERGSVYVYSLENNKPILTKRITDDNGFFLDNFGAAVATDGIHTIIGAPNANKTTNGLYGRGSVYFGQLF